MKKLPPKIPPPMPTMAPEDAARELRWRAEEDVRTLQRAREIEADKTRLGYARQIATEQVQNLKRVAGGTQKPRK